MSTKPQAKAVSPLERIDAHYRKAIQFRWLELHYRACVVTAIAFLLVPAVLLGLAPTLPRILFTLLLSPNVYVTSTLWVLHAHRFWIESPASLPAPSSSLSVWFATFTPRVLRLVAAHAWSGVVLVFWFTALHSRLSPASGLGWGDGATPRYPWHLNERLWFLLLGNGLFGAAIALRDVVKGLVGPRWPKARTSFPAAVQRALGSLFAPGPTSLLAETANAAQFTVIYTVLYFALRRSVWRAAVTYLPFLRPFAINFAKKGSLSWGLAYYLLVMQLTSLVALKPALAVINEYLCQPLPFGRFTRKSPLSADKYLLTALGSSNPFFVNHTVVELQRVAHSPARRKELFADTSRPALVHELFRALLSALGDSYALLATKGRKPSAKAPLPPAPVRDAHSIALKTGDIFRPAPKPTALQSLVVSALEGKPAPPPAPVRAALQKAHDAELAVAKKVEADVPALERWVGDTPFLGPVLAAAKLARGGFSAWAGREWARRAVAAALPEPDRLARLVDILATLCVASADEDDYGYVQAVLPGTLEALVRVRGAALDLGDDLVARAHRVSPSAGEAARADCAAVAAVAEDGIRRIAERFGTTLTAFRFPPGIALALTDVCRT